MCLQQMECMATSHQFLLLSSPPAKEKTFQALKAQYGSCFAFQYVMRPTSLLPSIFFNYCLVNY